MIFSIDFYPISVENPLFFWLAGMRGFSMCVCFRGVGFTLPSHAQTLGWLNTTRCSRGTILFSKLRRVFCIECYFFFVQSASCKIAFFNQKADSRCFFGWHDQDRARMWRMAISYKSSMLFSWTWSGSFPRSDFARKGMKRGQNFPIDKILIFLLNRALIVHRHGASTSKAKDGPNQSPF